jgi:long-chain fatty acid transport protein
MSNRRGFIVVSRNFIPLDERLIFMLKVMNFGGMMKRLFVVLTGLLFPLIAFASGFESLNVSTAALGQADAWMTRVNDASAIYYNPAAMMRVERNDLYVNFNLRNGSGDFEPIILDGATIEQDTSNSFSFNGYFVHRYSDQISFGVGTYAPYHQKVEWPKGSLPTFISRQSKLETRYITPSLAYQLAPWISIGGGIDIIRADAQYLRDFDFEDIAGVFPTTTVDVDGTEIGFNLGILLETQYNWQFASTFKSQTDLNLEGDASTGNLTPPIQDLFVDGGASLDMALPWRFGFGVASLWDRWSFEGNVEFAGWGSLETIRVNYFEETDFLRDFNLPRNYDNTISIRFGTEYDYSDSWTFRGGYLYEGTPVPDNAVDPWFPDGSRNGITLGATFHGQGWRADVGLMKQWLGKRNTPVINVYIPPLNLSAAGEYAGSETVFSFGAGYSF